MSLLYSDCYLVGLIFAFGYCLAYTCSRTLSLKYGYDALQIGVVLLAFGIGKSSLFLH